MAVLVVVFGVMTALSWGFLGVVWRRHGAIESKLREPTMVNAELVRLLAGSHAAGKALLEACPAAELHGVCAERRRVLAMAVAGVEEFTPSE
jgi:hypothetical protein